MLDHVRSMSDRAFEHLVGTVLKAALRAESVRITQRSRDGGVDGVLHFDALGMRLAVFEAKRYAEGNVVGRSLVDAFATAARRHRASHSLFVTSSRFSAEAVETARYEGIRLIDGTAFVELMAQHGIGLRAKETFVLYELDPAWSVNDVDEGD
jgi:restriction system protein